jgi:hypothetical protein
MPERGFDDLARARGIDHAALAVRLQCGLDSRVLVKRQ